MNSYVNFSWNFIFIGMKKYNCKIKEMHEIIAFFSHAVGKHINKENAARRKATVHKWIELKTPIIINYVCYSLLVVSHDVCAYLPMIDYRDHIMYSLVRRCVWVYIKTSNNADANNKMNYYNLLFDSFCLYHYRINYCY